MTFVVVAAYQSLVRSMDTATVVPVVDIARTMTIDFPRDTDRLQKFRAATTTWHH
jgi:hypothetical protein